MTRDFPLWQALLAALAGILLTVLVNGCDPTRYNFEKDCLERCDASSRSFIAQVNVGTVQCICIKSEVLPELPLPAEATPTGVGHE
jgi:hypothetical protein